MFSTRNEFAHSSPVLGSILHRCLTCCCVCQCDLESIKICTAALQHVVDYVRQKYRSKSIWVNQPRRPKCLDANHSIHMRCLRYVKNCLPKTENRYNSTIREFILMEILFLKCVETVNGMSTQF